MISQFSTHRQNELPFGIKIRPRLRLSAVEDLIKAHRILTPCPSRQTLIRYCEDGTLDAQLSRGGWEVYEDSFWLWANVGEAIAA